VHEGLALGPLRLVAIAYFVTQARSWHPGATISISPPNQLSANQFLVAFPVTSPFLPKFDHHEPADGIEALDKVEALQADAVVFDVTMPRMNGLEACRLMQQKRKTNLDVVFVTQHDSPQMMREALDAGARGYVVKSNATRDLLEAVEAVSQHRVFTALPRSPHASC
jgi:CheY-like chemotaxis protein